jgi:hypothetical protein
LQEQFKPSPKSFKNTFCVFHEVDIKSINDLKISYKSDAGSIYYYTEAGMYRLSNHWGRLANSKWRLIEQEFSLVDSKTKLGFAYWKDFFPDNDVEELYYLEANFNKLIVNYEHKNNPSFNHKAVLRTSIETKKRIKLARNILTLTNWAKYFDNSDIDFLRKAIVNELIYTNKTLEEIKRNLL